MKRFIIALAILFSFNSVCYASGLSQTEKEALCKLSLNKLNELCSAVDKEHKNLVTFLEKIENDLKSSSKEELLELLKMLTSTLKEEGNVLGSIQNITQTTIEIIN